MAVKRFAKKEKTPIRERDNESHKLLCEEGAKWLKKHNQNIKIPNCGIVCVELFSQIENEIPDVIGWTSWCSILIEVKVQRSDFLRDKHKYFRGNSKEGVGEFRYYLCDENLILENELPEKWGLLYRKNGKIEIVKKAEKQESNLLAERNMLTSYIRKLK